MKTRKHSIGIVLIFMFMFGTTLMAQRQSTEERNPNNRKGFVKKQKRDSSIDTNERSPRTTTTYRPRRNSSTVVPKRIKKDANFKSQRVERLPTGHSSEQINGRTYYVHNNSYYRRARHNNVWIYETCDPYVIYYGQGYNQGHYNDYNDNYYGNNAGVIHRMPRSAERMIIEGRVFYLFQGFIYKKIRRHGHRQYIRVGGFDY